MAKFSLCRIEGCDKPVYVKQLCNAHYLRIRKYGDPSITKRRANGPNHCQKRQCPAAKSIYDHMNNIHNPDIMKKRAKEYYLKNAELVKYKQKIYSARDDVRDASRARERKWKSENKERYINNQLRFRENNKDLVRSYKSKYRARKRGAVPPWLSEDHIRQIKAVYADARRLSEETGIIHHVDHIVPLAGKIVCGLHVPWNLRAIPGVENIRRPRTYRMGMD